jgi:pimeloyl-ACP methyl ester carboxylesterase
MAPSEDGKPQERLERVGDIELAWDELGDPAGEPMLMVMGLGVQLINWPEPFCEMLGDRGYRVIRFDNRDVGHSTRLKGPPPKTIPMLFGLRRGLAYGLEDMADDAVGLLDALEIDSAHFVGASMGGMISQVAGYRHPDRVRSLGLIMTGSGKRTSSFPRLRALGTLLAKPARSREQFVELAVKTFSVIGSPDHETDEEWLRESAGAIWDRGHSPAGVARQLHACTVSGDRGKRLGAVRAPTVVIHGTRDPLIRPSAGKDLAKSIPGAELHMLSGMGHDLPPGLWPEIAGLLAENARRAASAPATAATAA